MKVKHLFIVSSVLLAAVSLVSCGASKKSLRRSNQALAQAVQAAAMKETAEAARLYSDTSIPKG